MNLTEYIEKTRPLIIQTIDTYLNQCDLDPIDGKKLKQFTENGKMFRGSLFLITAKGYGYMRIKNILSIAAALEISHSGLLIHDDIADNDFLRRGKPSMHIRYGEEPHRADMKDYGKNLATFIGDTCFFMSCDLIQSAYIDQKIISKVMSVFSKELLNVCKGQILDYRYGGTEYEPTNLEILETYRLKTARYTTALPFLSGGFVGGAPTKDLKLLSILGDNIGLLYQLSDDMLNISGCEKKSGKSVGSDITENKKTLLRCLLMKKTTGKDKENCMQLFGFKHLSKKDIQTIKNHIKKYNIDKDIDVIMVDYMKKSQEIIEKLGVGNEYKKLFHTMLNYVVKREK